MSLLEAGFAIHSSWPVHTESEHGLHQAKKNAALSTILLTCRNGHRMRSPRGGTTSAAACAGRPARRPNSFRNRASPAWTSTSPLSAHTLAILSESWPVLTSEVDEKTGEPEAPPSRCRARFGPIRGRRVAQARPARTRHALRFRYRLVSDGVGRLQGRRVSGRRSRKLGGWRSASISNGPRVPQPDSPERRAPAWCFSPRPFAAAEAAWTRTRRRSTTGSTRPTPR